MIKAFKVLSILYYMYILIPLSLLNCIHPIVREHRVLPRGIYGTSISLLIASHYMDAVVGPFIEGPLTQFNFLLY